MESATASLASQAKTARRKPALITAVEAVFVLKTNACVTKILQALIARRKFARKTALKMANASMEYATASQASQAKPVKKTTASTAALITASANRITNANAFWASKARIARKNFVLKIALITVNALRINVFAISAGQAQPAKTACARIIAAELKKAFASMENACAKKALRVPTAA